MTTELTPEQQVRYEAWKSIQMAKIATVVERRKAKLATRARLRQLRKAASRAKNKRARKARRSQR
jgi:hypothetical protein